MFNKCLFNNYVMPVYNVGRDTVRKHMIIFRVQAFCLRILHGKVLTEYGGQWIRIADLQRPAEILAVGECSFDFSLHSVEFDWILRNISKWILRTFFKNRIKNAESQDRLMENKSWQTKLTCFCSIFSFSRVGKCSLYILEMHLVSPVLRPQWARAVASRQ